MMMFKENSKSFFVQSQIGSTYEWLVGGVVLCHTKSSASSANVKGLGSVLGPIT